ncbi:hypothetical protein [Dehalobacter sp.]|uniref:hypothetical protein n=1 Tax=Dehalobacter sp. TaxID=1962289 RepID=UPI0025842737|nr:hypothetical protein [Dehalobacter sp.]MDJ0305113.1 hypothetical protein [Dehalobacter sp.]
MFRTDRNGQSYAGYQEYRQHNHVPKASFSKIDDALIQKGLISIIQTRGKRTYMNIYFLPVFDELTGMSYPITNSVRTKLNYRHCRVPFIMVPATLEKWFLSSKLLTVTEKKVLLKCYRYNSLMYFGGVDPSVYREENGVTYISPRFYEDLYETESELLDIIDRLIDLELLMKVEVVVEYIDFEFDRLSRIKGDHTLGSAIPEGCSLITILRPKHQVKDDVLALKGDDTIHAA